MVRNVAVSSESRTSPPLLGQLGDGHRSALAAGESGEDVDRAQFGFDLFTDPDEGRGVGHVRGRSDSDAAGRRNPGDHRVQRGAVAGNDANSCSLGRETHERSEHRCPANRR
jgi:hypothetical protein